MYYIFKNIFISFSYITFVRIYKIKTQYLLTKLKLTKQYRNLQNVYIK